MKDVAVLSSGEKIANPQHLRRSARRLTHAQRNLARTQKGSKNREQARLQVAREPARIADQRLAGLHQLTTRLMRENQVLCVESLTVKHLVRNHTLAKAISDVGWGERVRQVEYKANWYGRTGRTRAKIDRWYPSANVPNAVTTAGRCSTLCHWTCASGPVLNVASGMIGMSTPPRPFLPWGSR